MSLSQAGAASNAYAPFASNWRAMDGYRQHGSANQNGASSNSANVTGSGADHVTLSDASRLLAALGGNGANASGSSNSSSDNGSGSSDFGQEASFLGGMADASLVALGIITPDQESGTQITFNSLAYQVSSSVSAGISQQNGQTVAQYGSDQQAEFIGQGQITTADGRTFDFQIEVDMDQSQQVEAASDGSAAGDTSGNAPVDASSAAPSNASASNTASTAQSSADPINWDAILKESKSLIDLLESIGQANQSANANSPAALANAAAGASSANTGATASAQGSSTSSSNSQGQQQNQDASAALAA